MVRIHTLWLSVLLLLAGAATSEVGGSAAPRQEADPSAALRALYEAAFESGETGELARALAEFRSLALLTIDADLEESLRLREEAGAAESEVEPQVARLLARARWGAGVAAQALGQPIFEDYAASFAGWNELQRLSFRAGQRAFGEARAALAAGEFERALERADHSIELAEPLGDWWGTAMALGARADALLASERFDEALVAASRARLLDHQLGLEPSELGDLLRMIDAGLALERFERALTAVEAAGHLASGPGQETWLREVRERKVIALRGVGRAEEASALELELEAEPEFKQGE